MATTKKEDDAGQAEAQKLLEKEQERGYVGQKVDPLPNSAYSLESGPDAPPIHEQPRFVNVADLED